MTDDVAFVRAKSCEAEVELERASVWTFLTNHAHVLLCIAADPEVRLRDIASAVGITERAAQRIVMELEQAGFLERERAGRRNRYRVQTDRPLRHPMDRRHQVGELLKVLSDKPSAPNRERLGLED